MTIGWAEKVRRDPKAGETTFGDPEKRNESTFAVDHRVYTWDGEWNVWNFDPIASEADEKAYILRREERIAAKGRPHICKGVFAELQSLTLNTRQQRRLIERKLKKQEARKNAPCHPLRAFNPNSRRGRRILAAVARGELSA